MDRLNPEQLEKMVDAALRSLPDRRAPASLAARVRAAIAARAAIPWWHKSWSYWPQWVRAVFLVFCVGLAGLVAYTGVYVQAGFDAAKTSGALAPMLAIATRLLGVGRGLGDFALLVARHIPSLWIDGTIAFVAGLYAMLFGLGATAYRTLWVRR
jgi:hypothetical protein